MKKFLISLSISLEYKFVVEIAINQKRNVEAQDPSLNKLIQDPQNEEKIIVKPDWMTPEVGKWLSETLKGLKSAGT